MPGSLGGLRHSDQGSPLAVRVLRNVVPFGRADKGEREPESGLKAGEMVLWVAFEGVGLDPQNSHLMNRCVLSNIQLQFQRRDRRLPTSLKASCLVLCQLDTS